MIHVLVEQLGDNSTRKFACGIGPTLPDGDKWVGASEYGLHHMVTCEGCGGPAKLGTPISELSGRPGHPGYEEFKRIASTWGYD